MEIKLFDSELKVMEVLWQHGELSAAQIAKILKEETGWNRNTTYTIIKKCIDKKAIERKEPGFCCRPLITKQEVQKDETRKLIDRMFDGSPALFLSAFASDRGLDEEEAKRLREMLKDLK